MKLKAKTISTAVRIQDKGLVKNRETTKKKNADYCRETRARRNNFNSFEAGTSMGVGRKFFKGANWLKLFLVSKSEP